MESVPDVVEGLHAEAQKQKSGQGNSCDPLPDRDPAIQRKQQHQDQDAHPAVGVQPDLGIRDIDRLDRGEMRQHHIQEAVKGLKGQRKMVALHRLGARERAVGRQQHQRPASAGNHGKPRKAHDPGHKPPYAAPPVSNKADNKIKDRKDTQHESDVIIAPDPGAQRDAVQPSV